MTYGTVIPISLGTSRTGLTLTAQLYDPSDGTPIGDPIATGFVERVGGRYDWTADALPDNQAVGVAFLSGADEVASTVINPEEVYDILSMKTKLDALNVDTTITLATPVDPATGNLTIIRGDAYKATTPKGALVWTETTGAWLDYVGKPAVFTAKAYKADGETVDTSVTPISKSATVEVVSGNTVKITVELDSADTKGLTDKQIANGWTADVQSTVATLEDDTLISISMTILPDVSPAST